MGNKEGLIITMLCVLLFLLGINFLFDAAQDKEIELRALPTQSTRNNPVFVVIADSTLVTNADLSALQDRYLDSQASCYAIANDTLSAIMEAINKMKNIHVIHKFTQVNDTLYYMQLEKIKEPNED